MHVNVCGAEKKIPLIQLVITSLSNGIDITDHNNNTSIEIDRKYIPLFIEYLKAVMEETPC